MILSKRAMLLLGAVFILAVLLLSAHLSYLAGSIAAAAVAIRIMVSRDLIPIPSRRIVRLLSVLGFLAVIIFKLIGGSWGDAAVSLLVLGTALKFLEIHSPRDASVLATAIFFLSTVPFIFHYEVYMALYLLVVPILCIWGFLAMSSVRKLSTELKLLLKIVVPAIPVTLLLFFGMPRPQGLWSLPQSVVNQKSDQSGISGEFNPNDVSQVVRSGVLAARVVFDGVIPNNRYFKAVTYEYNAGNNWYQSASSRTYQARLRYAFMPADEGVRPHRILGGGVKYRVLVEGQGTPFIPALTGSYSGDHDVFYLKGGSYVVREPLESRKAVDFEYPGREMDPVPSGKYLDELLFVSKRRNPRTWELVEELKAKAPDNQALARSLMAVFSEGYKYTLEPGRYGFNATDELIFERKSGFCGHYAQALAVMFRMAGVPSRIVGGYAGGKINENYVILRNYDAHAWTEAYIDGRWQRFDVVPQLASGSAGQEIEDMIRAEFEPKFRFTQMIASVVEYLDYHWSVWVLNFDEASRENFIASGKAVLILGGILLLSGLGIGGYWWLRRRKHYAIEVELVLGFLRRAEKLGHPINDGEELSSFVQRLLQESKCQEPKLEAGLLDFTKQYIEVRYARHTESELASLRRDLKEKAKTASLCLKALWTNKA